METIARLRVGSLHFEVVVDLEKAVRLKKEDKGNIQEIVLSDFIFKDYKKGLKASLKELEEAFGTQDIYEAAMKIIKQGEIVLPKEYRDKEREKIFKQIINFISTNCINPQTNLPYPPDVIERAIKEIGANVDSRNIAEQSMEIIKKIEKIIPIKIALKKIEIKVPPLHVGKLYGYLKKFMEKEDWLEDGSLKCIINLPIGIEPEFYDKINKLTDGSVITREIKEEKE